jgi:uncharacterized membrane protein
MVGYLYLLVALVAGATKGYCGKKTSGYTNSLGDSILANTIRMILCILIGFLIILAGESLSALLVDSKTLMLSALSGISTAVLVVTWLIIVKKSAYMLLEIFLMLGVLVPLLASSIFFGEEIKSTQWLGMLVLFAAVLLMCSYSNTTRTKITFGSLFLLIICGAANGVADFPKSYLPS